MYYAVVVGHLARSAAMHANVANVYYNIAVTA
jgi:hypothetical protein